MKYVVELKYTNPAHEHVSLRRRVDSVSRIVEAKSEDEALNRAANQQRALGFKIQEAKIVEQPKAPVKTEQLTEATVKDLRTSMKMMDLRHGVDSDKRDAGYKMSPAVRAAQKKSDVLSKVVKRPQAGTLAAVHKSMEREMQKESVEYIEEKLTAADPASKWISDFVASENPKFAGKSKKERINMALGAYYSAKRGGDMKEGFDPSSEDIAKMLVKKHGAGNVTKQHILDLEMDRDSMRGLDHEEIMKHVAKMDEAVSFGRSGGVMHYNPKTEKSEKEGTAKLYDPEKHDKKLSPKGGFAKMKKEEVEQIDELKKSTLASYVNKAANQVRAKTGIAASFETQGARKKDPANKAAYMNLAKDYRQGAKQRLTGIEKATAKLAKEEVEQVGEASHVAYLRPKVGAPSDVNDHFDLPVDSDSKKDAYSKFAKVFGSNMAKHYEVVHVKPKAVKEEIEAIKEANTRVVNKEVKKEKAAETAVAAARRAKNTKNKVETQPKLDMDVAGSEKKYVTKV
jgi:hypothetical protein